MGGRFPQVEFYIGGKSLKTPANFLVSFLYEDTIAHTGDSWTLQIVDPTWKVLENDLIPSLAKNQNRPVSFRFGWGGSRMSKLRYGTVTEYKPAEITRGGIRVTIKGFDTVSGAPEAHESVEATYQGKISDVVTQIATKRGWVTDIEETIEIQELEGRKKGLKPKIWRKTNKTDLAFLNELAQRAKSVEGGGGYRVFLDSTQDPPKLHFHPDKAHKFPLHREYVVQTDRMGEVISFVPEVEGAAVVALGASHTSVVYRDPTTRKSQELSATPTTATEGVALGPKSAVDGKTKVKMAMPSATPEEAQARLDAYYEGLSWAVSKANLTVVGDPDLLPGRIISVVVKTPSNQKYFISGLYLVERVVHQVNLGEYTSELALINNAYDVGDLDLNKGTVQRGQ